MLRPPFPPFSPTSPDIGRRDEHHQAIHQVIISIGELSGMMMDLLFLEGRRALVAYLGMENHCL
jgi:hypothetical protein